MKLTSADKEKLFVGADAWTTHSTEDLPSVRVSDGPGGLRIEAVTGLGFNRSHPAVCHPTASLLACSFDRELLHELGEMLAEECQAQSVDVLLGPGVNHKRSPLCGRNFEYYSEDPVLSGELGASYVNGLQENGIGASLKHFAGNSREKGRLISDSLIDERALREIYLKQFETVVRKAHPWTIMAAYNKLNGIYCTQNRKLLKDTARNEWGFDGVFVSDWGAVSDPVSSMKGGLNLEMPGGDHGTSDLLDEALKSGALTPEELDESAEYMLNLVQKTGYAGRHRFDLEKHLDFARKAAQQSAVLLENNGALPLRKEKIAFIGPYADTKRLQSSWAFSGEDENTVTVWDAASEVCEPENRRVATGCTMLDQDAVTAREICHEEDWQEKNDRLLAEAMSVAAWADTVVLCLGEDSTQSGEATSKARIQLPAVQLHLLREIKKTGKRIVTLIFTGRPLELMEVRELSDALMICWLPGTEGGHGILDVLTGKVSPSGRLTVSFPYTVGQEPLHYDMYPTGRPKPDEKGNYPYTSRYLDCENGALYPFGYGLSYTSFAFTDPKLSAQTMSVRGAIAASVTVKNTGSRKGSVTVQLYIRDLTSSRVRPVRELADFKKISLDPGAEEEVSFVIREEMLRFWTAEETWESEAGKFHVWICNDSRDGEPLEFQLIKGEKWVPEIMQDSKSN